MMAHEPLLIPRGTPRGASRAAGSVSAVGAFTLVDVLVVLALVVVLAALLVFMRENRPRRAPGVHCLTNTKQLVLGWIMYASDFQDKLVPNQPYAGLPVFPTNNWVGGIMDWSSGPDNTNTGLLLRYALSPYIKNAGAYRCPADTSASAVGERVRSYSMNGFVGDVREGEAVSGWKKFLKLADMSRPVQQFVIVEEHPNSINDAWFFTDVVNTNTWGDLPASWHGGAGTFAFADGHSEIHRWSGSGTKPAMAPKGGKPRVVIRDAASASDLGWILRGATEPEAGPAAPDAERP
jgi:prepilin-type processing-associated H-X9-DG protein